MDCGTFLDSFNTKCPAGLDGDVQDLPVHTLDVIQLDV